MDKYSGCNIVESVVTTPPKPPAKAKPRRAFFGFAVRLAVAGVVIAALCAVKFVHVAPFSTVGEILRDIFCYDVFGRTGFGEMPILARIFGG
ncbi:MAG: hypothetical protein NC184_06955 [Roseburia sp.]|nr:hypothetical protein [Roseburia sp.]